ncbi:DUF2479 domain-containing protein [Clostridium perfringens]|uniref:BppU family phage baseplate upper protein n=1 Tax=Clostridium perfringens TaxID=1502 RepID=UPI000BBFCCA1|nr:BppU family phage baseplate upper protein [Clostridium perfringens]ASY52769.1 hypothetical protein BG908_14355 [Clostridium perfringens]AWS24353.1 DUF2479 domain-containing protein [Clostridium perfringens]PZT50915.1 DUF2479 domain-containing protein [Clostridium perfringens]
MSEIGLNINVDSYNNEGIKTIKGNNNAEIYKLYILKNKRRLSLVGKTVKLGYVMVGTTNGDVIENLNITNAEQGEITFPITNRISKKDGVYSCQLAIYGADGFLEHTATFGLTVEANIFTKIAGEIADSKDLTYIERILEESKTVSGDLKTNIPVATNLNSSLESNISNARNINTTLADTTEKSKVAATDAIEKKSQLESSITKAKEFIDGLDGSQNIPQLRLDVTELQNGLKSNQALAYSGSSIVANNTLEGRTEGMKIKGRTLVNLVDERVNFIPNLGSNTLKVDNNVTTYSSVRIEPNTEYYIIKNKKTDRIICAMVDTLEAENAIENLPVTVISQDKVYKIRTTSKKILVCYIKTTLDESCKICIAKASSNYTEYFEGIKSFGEAEQEGDKYKISILSSGKNLNNIKEWENGSWNGISGQFEKPPTTVNKRISSKTKEKLLTHKPIVFSGNKTFNIAIRYYDRNDNFIQDVSGFLPNKTTTPPKNAMYFSLTLAKGDLNEDVDINWVNSLNLQIEEGTVATSYQSHQSFKKDILIKELLREWDTMYEDNGQVKVCRGSKQYLITGNENIQTSSNFYTNKTLFFFFDLQNANKKSSSINICNRFPSYPTDMREVIKNQQGEGCFIGDNNSGLVQFYINKDKLTTPDINGFKSWLKANPTTIVYQLDKSTTEIVENCIDIDLDTFGEKTYFSIENSLPGTLDFKVPSNIASIVQSNSKAINELYNLIDTLVLPNILQNTTDIEMLKLEKLK